MLTTNPKKLDTTDAGKVINTRCLVLFFLNWNIQSNKKVTILVTFWPTLYIKCDSTLKHAYSKHAWIDDIVVNWFILNMGFKHIVRLINKTDYINNEAKSPIPDISL